MKKHSFTRRLGCFGLLLLILISGFLVYGVRISLEPPIVREYTVINAKISSPITLVMLTDLHGCEHGPANSELIAAVRECKPDLILMCGDMINAESETDEDILVTAAAIKELSKIAPVYYSLGNHELARIGSYWPSRLPEFKEAGATILERDYVDLDIRGNSIRLGGVYTPNNLHSHTDDGKDCIAFYSDLCDTDRYVILMEHRPASVTDQLNYRGFEPELVLSGHLHGGHVVLPLLGPFYSANMGFFPEHAIGKFNIGSSVMIVSAGLSTARHIIPRINNPTEITKIILEPKNE